ncbi:MBL fold metallo-hydrolase [Dyadobacter psychrotolerans]|uniref:MBL fold metallo-hydrolase n=1 Tax=Dyadobacter psychrotolerans TaxID=2541721 RepID=A0A4R5DSN2_9BACT|nr:MBL fold metallo-hydrolase [Dyadobacter psychrotolerans]TDE17496.1 MBL fold metallo-hydrolase [Dyadobacter psychrotolerans]
MENFKFIKISKVVLETVTIHCVQAPEDGELTNAQLIETPGKLILVDTLQLKPHAEELRLYIESLGKPLERVIITHLHPDHWMGAPSFNGTPVYALADVIGGINAMADYFIGFHRSLHPDNADDIIYGEKNLPTEVLTEGILEIDGVALNLIKVSDTECPVNLIVEIPAEKVLLAQDLIYNNVYAFFGDKTSDEQYCFENWIGVLTKLKSKGYLHVLPGHGEPSDASVLDQQIEYLNYVKQLVYQGLQGEELIGKIVSRYPDYKLQLTLHMSNYMLFMYQNP